MMSGANESEQQMQQTHGSYTKALTRKHRHKSIRIDDLLVWRVWFAVVVVDFVIRINISMHVCVFFLMCRFEFVTVDQIRLECVQIYLCWFRRDWRIFSTILATPTTSIPQLSLFREWTTFHNFRWLLKLLYFPRQTVETSTMHKSDNYDSSTMISGTTWMDCTVLCWRNKKRWQHLDEVADVVALLYLLFRLLHANDDDKTDELAL